MGLRRTAITLENVSKRYRLYPSRLALLKEIVRAGGRRHHSEHWALSEIDLTVPEGQCIGLIGRNGSGKSTLLRIIAGIVHPTTGRVELNGRLSTILDLASGFHPHLTGRQNIYLKGAIHGLTRAGTASRFEEIIEFSGLEEYIDRPISTYSSGMVIRLGFAIAIHLEFDILLVDEVLTVGDVVFQRQCLSKIREYIDSGKTIILASHALGDVSAVCNRVVLLRNGRIQHDGETESILEAYWQACERDQNRIPRHLHPFAPENIYGTDTKEIALGRVEFLDAKGRERSTFWTGEKMVVSIPFTSQRAVKDPLFRVQFFRNDGLWVHGANTYRQDFQAGLLEGEGEIRLEYERLNLLEGDYYVTVGIWPDEHRSLFTDIAYDCHEWQYVIEVKSKRRDGGGIVSNPFSWRLTRNKGAIVE